MGMCLLDLILKIIISEEGPFYSFLGIFDFFVNKSKLRTLSKEYKGFQNKTESLLAQSNVSLNFSKSVT